MRTKQTTQRVINEQPRRGWAKLSGPRYHAVEIADEPGIFRCPARGPGQWTAEQLQGWAERVGAEVVLVEWAR